MPSGLNLYFPVDTALGSSRMGVSVAKDGSVTLASSPLWMQCRCNRKLCWHVQVKFTTIVT